MPSASSQPAILSVDFDTYTQYTYVMKNPILHTQFMLVRFSTDSKHNLPANDSHCADTEAQPAEPPRPTTALRAKLTVINSPSCNKS